MARILRPLTLVVAAFVLGALLNPFASDVSARTTSSAESKPPFWAPTTSSSVPGQTLATADQRTEQGAIAAAAAFVCTGQRLVDMTADEVETFLRQRVTRAAADRVVKDHLRDIQALRDALGRGSGPIVYREAVVAHRVDSFGENEARVAIWHVGVLARLDVAPPQAGWMISTVDLRWERGGWKVVDEIAVPGPAPILNDSVAPATADELVNDLDGFTDFGGAS
jgi:hypothetical protein